MKRMFLLPLILLIFMTSQCIEFHQPVSRVSPNVKVLLSKTDKMVIKPNHNYLIFFDGKKEIGRGNIYISYTTNGIMINGVLIQSESLEIDPSGYFSFKEKQYRGNIKVLKQDNQLLLINILDMESYLYSVVPSEMPAGWEYEALKAQAVVARTYAVYEMVLAQNKKLPFDLYSDTRSQVYNGMMTEAKFTSAAVDHTMGQVIKYKDRVIQSFFHSCSGGHTESSDNVWGASFPYLKAVPSPYGKIKDNYKWTMSLSLETLQSRLELPLPIKDIKVLSRSGSKRIMEVEIILSNDQKTFLEGKKLRQIVGNTSMKSTRANLKIQTNMLNIEGVGYGHGVGMGQWDAQGMALEGIKYDKIIAYFYSGTRIQKMW